MQLGIFQQPASFGFLPVACTLLEKLPTHDLRYRLKRPYGMTYLSVELLTLHSSFSASGLDTRTRRVYVSPCSLSGCCTAST